jgi:hypothetical protein
VGLLDIEVLETRVRSASARIYIQEAIASYKAGAYRSCIVATWIALIHDFVDKFRELALSGDKAATTLTKEFDRIQSARDTAAALQFEREVLDKAKDEYELLSAQEHLDLKRLFEDRNRFAHPNINQDAGALVATPELERPPVQGKVALSSIQAAVDSPYFPKKTDDAVVALRSTPLVRAKAQLVRDFFLGCITSIIREKPVVDVFERRLAAATACRQMHSAVIEPTIQGKLAAIIDKTDDTCLSYLTILIAKVPDLAVHVGAGARLRLNAYVRQLPESSLSVLNFASDLDFLQASVVTRLADVSASQLREFTQRAVRQPTRPVLDRALKLLEESKSWDSSNAVSSAIAERMIDQLAKVDAERILAASSNGEVKWAFNYPPLVKKLIQKGLLTNERVQEVAKANEADALVDSADAAAPQ